MSKLKFHIHSPGDRSVGLWPLNATVTIEDNVIWDKDDVQEFKKFYADMYDTRVDNVLTEREFILREIKAEEQEIQMLQMELFDEPGDHRERLEKSIEKCRNTIDVYERQLKNPEIL